MRSLPAFKSLYSKTVLKKMKIAIEGCCHGELDNIYATLRHMESTKGIKIDLLICCGDFQAVRNQADLHSMAVPTKYRKMQSFHKYYSGEKVAPILTVFIGGNHESSSYLWELPYGGWVCPNVYYLGYAGMVSYKGLRIGGISGIYKKHHYHLEHFEIPPLHNESCRSIYHTRKIDVDKLKKIKKPIDIFFSHDWPLGIYNYGDKRDLIRRKPFFKDEIDRNALGSPCGFELLRQLQPSYWFAGHLHVKFAAIVPHENREKQPKYTKFLALDKCLPNRDFLQILEFAEKDPEIMNLSYDLEWLKILNSTHPVGEELSENEILDAFGTDLTIPKNFERSAPLHLDNAVQASKSYHENSQTARFCNKLKIINPCHSSSVASKPMLRDPVVNPEDIDFNNVKYAEVQNELNLDSNQSDCKQHIRQSERPYCLTNPINPDEIAIDDE